MKNTISITKIALIAIAVSSIIGCKKTKKEEIIIPVSTPKNAQEIMVGKVWKIISRVENGGTASLPDCAKDDILELKANGTYNSLVNTTLCNPSETDVVGGAYQFSTDKKTITFTIPSFTYAATVIDAKENQVILEFDLGPGFIIRDTFVPKP
jgi:hypothetical protein